MKYNISQYEKKIKNQMQFGKYQSNKIELDFKQNSDIGYYNSMNWYRFYVNLEFPNSLNINIISCIAKILFNI